MKTRIVSLLSILLLISIIFSCAGNRNQESNIGREQSKINSSEGALQTALNYLEMQNIDTTKHDMSAPEAVQEIEIQGKRGWRVSWKLKDFQGKGGQLVVIVDETGMCEQGWGE